MPTVWTAKERLRMLTPVQRHDISGIVPRGAAWTPVETSPTETGRSTGADACGFPNQDEDETI